MQVLPRVLWSDHATNSVTNFWARSERDTMITLHEHVMPAGHAEKNAAGERCTDAREYNQVQYQ